MTIFGGKQLVAKSKPATSVTSLPSKTINSKIVLVTLGCFIKIFKKQRAPTASAVDALMENY